MLESYGRMCYTVSRGDNMEVRVLEYFLAVARERSISGAAEALHLTQPTLSRQIKELEDELGKTLIIRGSRRITLTEEGGVGVIGKAIGKNKAVSFMLKWLEEHPVDDAWPKYSIYTSGTENCGQFEEKLKNHGIETMGRLQIGAAIGTHIGPNAFGIIYVEKT